MQNIKTHKNKGGNNVIMCVKQTSQKAENHERRSKNWFQTRMAHETNIICQNNS